MRMINSNRSLRGALAKAKAKSSASERSAKGEASASPQSGSNQSQASVEIENRDGSIEILLSPERELAKPSKKKRGQRTSDIEHP